MNTNQNKCSNKNPNPFSLSRNAFWSDDKVPIHVIRSIIPRTITNSKLTVCNRMYAYRWTKAVWKRTSFKWNPSELLNIIKRTIQRMLLTFNFGPDYLCHKVCILKLKSIINAPDPWHVNCFCKSFARNIQFKRSVGFWHHFFPLKWLRSRKVTRNVFFYLHLSIVKSISNLSK